MPNVNAFTALIGPKLPNNAQIPFDEAGSTLGPESNNTIGLINQTSPTWVLTFVRWEIRDTLRTPSSAPFSVRNPLVVESDCIQLTVSDNKATLTPSMSALLLETDVNYSVQVHPGDFVFVNILNWEQDARALATKANNSQAINEPSDGFKGFYKVQSVRKIVHSDPTTGTRTAAIKIDAFAFTEFNNTIYFNPNLINQKSLSNQGLFISDVATMWKSYARLNTSGTGAPQLQELLAVLIQCLIGSGVNSKANIVGGIPISQNTHFLVPTLVGQLLGIPQSTQPTIAAKDIYIYLFGLQQYSSGQGQSLQSGMNPSNFMGSPWLPKYPGFYYTSVPCPGNSVLKPEFWNQVKLWSILNQYTNSPLNELYTCFRIAPTGSVMPTVVFRQIPFTSTDFVNQKFGPPLDGQATSIPVTPFLSIPRWKIGSESVYSVDIGTDEAARINFVQYYARTNFTKNGVEIAQETVLPNYVFDKDDIARSGLRPYIVQNQFDDLPNTAAKQAPVWARIFGDAVIGGHLKLNGTIDCFGIIDPIAVGDNLEFDRVVYHIEQIIHTASINPMNGMKTFRTTLSVSHGVSVNSTADGTLYSQMTYANAYTDRLNDYSNEQILPGVSESQDTAARPINVDNISSNPAAQNRPFPQPTLTRNKIVTGE